MLWIVLLIVHGLAALFLIGAITHQAVSSVWNPSRRNFVGRFANVPSNFFANAVVVTYILTFLLGAWIYTEYRYQIKPLLEDLELHRQVGLFELKEHAAAIGLLILPAYWYFWKKVPRDRPSAGRTGLTLLVAVCAWLGFFAGHILNNARGF